MLLVEVRGQLAGIGSLHPSHGSLGSNSGGQFGSRCLYSLSHHMGPSVVCVNVILIIVFKVTCFPLPFCKKSVANGSIRNYRLVYNFYCQLK